jgi:2-isopropylmalate synthase
VADKKKTVTEADLEALVGDELYQPAETWELLDVQVHTGTHMTPTAVVKLRDNATGEMKIGAAIGAGPVDAVYKSINEVVKAPNNLVEFLVQA